MKYESCKVGSEAVNAIRKLSKQDGRSISWHITKSISNYLVAKKILTNKIEVIK